MPPVLNFYLDDSGTRHPSHAVGKRAEHGYDWFAHGGILIADEDEQLARDLHSAFCSRFEIEVPLHSSEIRGQNGGFAWLRSIGRPAQQEFYEALYQLMRELPAIGLACVVDRPGYCRRYMEMYEQNPWLLCKTAFSVAVERAAKFAQGRGRRLRVAPERCNKKEDALLRGYYDALKDSGMPFAVQTSDKYAPLDALQFSEILYEFKPKAKSSPMAQFADLFLWPICVGGYHLSNRPYARLMEDGKLIECGLPQSDWPTLASKYSCFELVERKP